MKSIYCASGLIRKTVFAAAASACFAAETAYADVTALGPVFDINSDYKTDSHDAGTRIAKNAAGDFVIIYHAGYSIYAREYTASGTAKGPEITVTSNAGAGATVAIDDDGDYVVTWSATTPTTDSLNLQHILAQRYKANGSLSGDQVDVTSVSIPGTSNYDIVSAGPLISMDADGDYVIAWTEDHMTYLPIPAYIHLGGAKSTVTYARIYDVKGAPKSAAIVVDKTAKQLFSNFTPFPRASSQFIFGLAVAPSGNFVTITSVQSKIGHQQFVAKRFDAQGKGVGLPATVSSFSTSGGIPTIGGVHMDSSGDFDVDWIDYSVDESGYSVSVYKARQYSANGSPKGESIVLTSSPDYITGASLAVEPSGSFVAAWQVSQVISTSFSIQPFLANGSANGAPLVMTAPTDNSDFATAIDGNGGFVAAWHQQIVASNEPIAIVAQLFQVP